jgi:hypothetical protein
LLLIRCEAVVLGPDGLSRFEELSRREADRTAILHAFDLIELDDKDLRDLPFLDRKAALARLLRGAKAGLLLNEHIAEDGPTVFAHACRLGAEGIVSRKVDGTPQSGPFPRLDQGSQSRQHRSTAGTERDMEPTNLRPRAQAMTRRNSEFGACRVRQLEHRFYGTQEDGQPFLSASARGRFLAASITTD